MQQLYSYKKVCRKTWKDSFLLLVLLGGLLVTSKAQQPFHGKKYIVAQKNPAASDDNSGTFSSPFRTISKAATLAQPGDTVLVHAGIYREWVAPARGGIEGLPVTYMGDPKEQVIIRGSEVFKGRWQPLNGHPDVYATKIPAEFFTAGFNPFKIVFSEKRGGGRQGQIFINGKEIFEAKEKGTTSLETKKDVVEKTSRDMMYETPASWCTEDGETIFLHLPIGIKSIEQSFIEVSIRRHLFAPVHRAEKYINIKGFIFEHCANDASFPQVGAVSCRSGQHWIIENNIIRNIKTIGLDCGAENENVWQLPDILPEDRYNIGGHHEIYTLAERRIAGRHLILNNTVSDCGQCGIAGVFSDGTVIKGNIVERCGAIIPGFETGGIKIHGLMGGSIEANLVRDNEAWGIWLDCGYIGSRVTRNVVVNNKISGIFFECCNGPGWIDNNIIAYNRGDGIYSHDASGIHVANNLIFGNKNFGIYMCVATDRKVSPYYYATGMYENELSACSWERIYNNIIVQNEEGPISLPQPGKLAQDNFSDYNIYAATANNLRFVRHFRNGEKHLKEEVVDEARKAFMKYGDANLSGADLALWKNDKGYAMNFSQWQSTTENDKNSLIGNVSATLDLKNFQLVVILDKTANKLQCKPVTTHNVRNYAKFSRQIDKDFLGRPMPANFWLPGAFQSFKPGNNKLTIWPVKFIYPAMPPKVPMEPAPGSDAFKPLPPPLNQ
jgi:parallel beta-helix repeat protein